jgi:lipoprotein-releasing system permease protein
MLGIALGVAALIIVLSVMNGFQKEVRDRMLSVISHIEVFDAGRRRCPTGSATAAAARSDPRVVAPRPSCHAQALVSRGDERCAAPCARHRPG